MLTGTPTVQNCDTPLSHEEQWQLVQRIANSKGFAHSASLRAFLLYVAEHAIAGRLDAIKEQQIGSQVLGRRHDYDPAEDNIVRVRARLLRKKVEDYFLDEGLHEPVVISIPKGHYVPLFQLRPVTPTEKAPAPEEDEADSSESIGGSENQRRAAIPTRLRVVGRSTVLPWLIVAACVAALLFMVLRPKDSKQSAANESQATSIGRAFWAQLFSPPDHQTTVVTADAGFALWQDLTKHTVNLGEYLSRKYLQENDGTSGLREVAVRRQTSSADVSIALRLADTAHAFGSHIATKFARSVDIHDLKSGTVILLGSRRSNPWVQLFEPRLNFTLSNEASLPGPSFSNRSPKAGELKIYSLPSRLEVQGAENNTVDSYAVAALLPNPSGSGMVLIIEGLSMEGTEAAGEIVTNLEKFGSILSRIGVKLGQPAKSFEMLLKLTAVAGGYGDAELIAWRCLLQ